MKRISFVLAALILWNVVVFETNAKSNKLDTEILRDVFSWEKSMKSCLQPNSNRIPSNKDIRSCFDKTRFGPTLTDDTINSLRLEKIKYRKTNNKPLGKCMREKTFTDKKKCLEENGLMDSLDENQRTDLCLSYAFVKYMKTCGKEFGISDNKKFQDRISAARCSFLKTQKSKQKCYNNKRVYPTMQDIFSSQNRNRLREEIKNEIKQKFSKLTKEIEDHPCAFEQLFDKLSDLEDFFEEQKDGSFNTPHLQCEAERLNALREQRQASRRSEYSDQERQLRSAGIGNPKITPMDAEIYRDFPLDENMFLRGMKLNVVVIRGSKWEKKQRALQRHLKTLARSFGKCGIKLEDPKIIEIDSPLDKNGCYPNIYWKSKKYQKTASMVEKMRKAYPINEPLTFYCQGPISGDTNQPGLAHNYEGALRTSFRENMHKTAWISDNALLPAEEIIRRLKEKGFNTFKGKPIDEAKGNDLLDAWGTITLHENIHLAERLRRLPDGTVLDPRAKCETRDVMANLECSWGVFGPDGMPLMHSAHCLGMNLGTENRCDAVAKNLGVKSHAAIKKALSEYWSKRDKGKR